MRALKLTGPLQFDLVETPTPTPAAGEVRVRVGYAGICGSDLSIAKAGPIFGDDYQHPILGLRGGHFFGHEFSGRVEACGDGVDLAEGTLVAVRANVWCGTCASCTRGEHHLCPEGGFIGIQGGGGAFSEQVVVGLDQVHVLPEPFDEQTGALVEPLAVGWHAVRRAPVVADTRALVVGAGPVGLACVLALVGRGVQHVLVSEPSAHRRAVAEQFGARTVDPTADDAAAVLADFAPTGIDVSYETAGAGEVSFNAAVQPLRPGGTMVMVATGYDPVPVSPLTLMLTEINLTGSNAYEDVDYTEVIAAVAEGRIDPRPLISSVIALEDIATAGFDHLVNGGGAASEVKMLVRP